jgi:nitrite reductase (NADH) large subunit
MEGGINYLRAVVVEDSLGIAADLERDIQQLIDVYQCEWKEVVQNPELRKRFTHFVNTPERDPTVVFDSMREQKRAKEWV